MNRLTTSEQTLINKMCPVASQLTLGSRIESLTAGIRGSIFYVDGVNGSATAGGTTWADSLTTITAALAKCTANAGDVVLVAPYHQEVKAASGNLFDMSKAGVTLLGVSNGAYNSAVASGVGTYHNRPLLILDHADATITASAVNCRMAGFDIISDVADVKVLATVAATADGFIFEENIIRDNGAAVDYLVGVSVAAAANYVRLLNNRFYTTAAGGTNNAILLAGANTGLVIKGNFAYGKFATGCLLGSAAAQVSVDIEDNILVNAEAEVAMALHTSSTGVFARNLCGGITSIATAVTGNNALWCFENYVTGAPAASGALDPAADSDT